MLKFKHHVLMFLVIFLFTCLGCEEETAYYYDIAGSGEIDSVRVFYPESLETSTGTYHATTLSGGFTNTKEDMYWIAEYLSKEADMIVFAVSAADNSAVSSYTQTHLQCFDVMKSENANSNSIVYDRIGKMALTGYSMGGGAVLNASHSLGDQVDSVVALAPYDPNSDLSGTTAPVLIMVGENDRIAPKQHSENGYNALPDSILKCLLEFDNFRHLSWMNNTGSSGDEPKILIKAWFDFTLNGNEAARSTFSNPPDDVVLNWNTL